MMRLKLFQFTIIMTNSMNYMASSNCAENKGSTDGELIYDWYKHAIIIINNG